MFNGVRTMTAIEWPSVSGVKKKPGKMPRKDTKLRLDERILPALREKAEETGMSFNALCEAVLFNYAKSIGKIAIDAEPDPEKRGGKRSGAGRPKASPDDADVRSGNGDE
jgi:hypothetical protein